MRNHLREKSTYQESAGLLSVYGIEYKLTRIDGQDFVGLPFDLVLVLLFQTFNALTIFALPHYLRLRLANNFASQNQLLELICFH